MYTPSYIGIGHSLHYWKYTPHTQSPEDHSQHTTLDKKEVVQVNTYTRTLQVDVDRVEYTYWVGSCPLKTLPEVSSTPKKMGIQLRTGPSQKETYSSSHSTPPV